MKTALDPRHANRQKAVQDLFAWAFHKQSTGNELAKKVIGHTQTIDAIVTEVAPEFPIDRINHIDLAILRLAIYELVVAVTEPPKAIIDEAVELGKEFGSENSPSFINGALGKVLFSPIRIKKIIADRLGAEEKHITAEADLRKDLNATDLEIADLIIHLEKDLGLEMEKGVKFATVRDILDYVEDQKD